MNTLAGAWHGLPVVKGFAHFPLVIEAFDLSPARYLPHAHLRIGSTAPNDFKLGLHHRSRCEPQDGNAENSCSYFVQRIFIQLHAKSMFHRESSGDKDDFSLHSTSLTCQLHCKPAWQEDL